MGEKEEGTNSDKVLIVPLNEDSKKITQVLSNEKAMKMLDILADDPMSASDVAEKLQLPLTTVKYNLDGLVDADLIKVKETKWSKKGRQIKIYEPVQKFIVVAPGSTKNDRSSIIGMLKKYLGLVAGALFAATGLEAITRSFGMGTRTSMSQEDTTAFLPNEEPMAYMAKDLDVPTGEMSANGTSGIENVSQDIVASSAPSGSEGGTELMREGLTNATGNQTETLPMSQTFTDNMTTVSEPVSGIFREGILSHVSVWFFFGCLFVITLLFVREMYNRKKNI